MAHNLDHYEVIAVELLRALRGRRSQAGLSRRIGYGSNIVHRWESRRCWPTASRFLEICRQLGKDVERSYARMFLRRPEWLDDVDPCSPHAVAAFLCDLRGKTPIVELAARTGINRFTISRWLKAQAHPNLPQLLQLIDATSGRMLDFLSSLVDPSALPATREAWQQLEAARHLALEQPWSHAVLRALQLSTCPTRGDQVGFIAARLDLPEPRVRELRGVLQEAGQVARSGGRWVPSPIDSVDTGSERAESRALKVTWADVATRRLETGAPGSFGYSLFEVSADDMRRLRDLHLEYVRAMLSIISGSRSTECVGLYTAHLLDMAEPGANALRPRSGGGPET